MNIEFAHLKERAQGGGWINFAVFNAKSTVGKNDELLCELTERARNAGLLIQQSALAYRSGNRWYFHGDRNLVSYLSRSWIPCWNNRLSF